MVSSLESGNQSSLLGGLFGTSDRIGLSSGQITAEEAIATLTSRRFLEKFINENDLLKKIYPLLWDQKNDKWLEGLEEIPTSFDGYGILSSSLEISFDKSLLMVEFTFHDAQNVAFILNNLIDEVNSFIRAQTIIDAEKNINFLKQEINKTQLSDSKDMLYKLVEQQTQSIMLANTREDFAFKIIDPAMQPIGAYGPNRKLIVIIGTLVGTIISFFLVLFMNFINISRSS